MALVSHTSDRICVKLKANRVFVFTQAFPTLTLNHDVVNRPGMSSGFSILPYILLPPARVYSSLLTVGILFTECFQDLICLVYFIQ